MELYTENKNEDGSVTKITYKDSDSFEVIDLQQIKQVYAVCFHKDQMVIVFHGKRQDWGLVGGKIEPNETLEAGLKREIQEETNMKMLSYKPIGYQKVETNDKIIYQLRYVCEVEPYGDFKEDPAGSIVAVKLIDANSYKEYFDWGKIGDRIISRAIEINQDN
jgi:ADP-ribose pyrophosphatase YjhB (NUDIX family)